MNESTNETYEYELSGIADEPLAEDHVIIQCQAREKTDQEFLVRNYSTTTPMEFEVESDIVHISGPSSIGPIPPGGEAGYKLSFLPLQAGNVTGCVMFKQKLGPGVSGAQHFSWYTVEVQTGPSKPQQCLTLTCVVRQAIAVGRAVAARKMGIMMLFDSHLNNHFRRESQQCRNCLFRLLAAPGGTVHLRLQCKSTVKRARLREKDGKWVVSESRSLG